MNKSYFSANLNVQLIGATLEAMGVENIVFSPGSRNGSLIMHLSAMKAFKTYTLVDERSAAYTAMGMAQKTRKPVVICCTSGSASVNYYPAITEAFYQNIPLIVLTADRPRRYIDQFNGQTIRQENVFEKHTYHNENLLEEETDEALTQNFLSIKKTIIKSIENSGPVHINIPLSEPLYDTVPEKKIHFEKLTVPEKKISDIDFDKLRDIAKHQSKIMFLVGMHDYDDRLNQLINDIAKRENVIFLTENTSNLHHKDIVNKIDNALFLLKESKKESFSPDLLITLGQNIVSKKIKQFLRENPPKHHWHVNPYWHPDTFNVLSEKIKINSWEFLDKFKTFELPKSDYKSLWLNSSKDKNKRQAEFLRKTPFSDLKVFEKIIKQLPHNIVLHYSNSSVIRYAQLFDHHKSIEVFCNRGTSGIDGATSTAVGSAMCTEKQTVLVTGDLSFFYDSNGLWNKYIPHNFRLIVINNGGGDIFKIIPGPANTGVLEESFFVSHKLSPKHLAMLYGFDYVEVNDLENLEKELNILWEGNNKKILCVNTFREKNSDILKEYIKA